MDGSSSEHAESPFRLLTIYDSPRANREAVSASEVVLRELGEDIEVDRSSWDLNSLAPGADWTVAADAAARADVILFALSETSPSEPLKKWIDEWQKKRVIDGGLLALIPSGESETGGDLAEYLYETAVSAHMDFLCRKKRRYYPI